MTTEIGGEMRKVHICEICKKSEAIYAVQVVGGEISTYTIGWHIRGFPVKKVCEKCLPDFKEKLEKELAE